MMKQNHRQTGHVTEKKIEFRKFKMAESAVFKIVVLRWKVLGARSLNTLPVTQQKQQNIIRDDITQHNSDFVAVCC